MKASIIAAAITFVAYAQRQPRHDGPFVGCRFHSETGAIRGRMGFAEHGEGEAQQTAQRMAMRVVDSDQASQDDIYSVDLYDTVEGYDGEYWLANEELSEGAK